MKKTITSLALFLPVLLFAQEKFTLKGKVGKLNEPAKVFLTYRSGAETIRDSAVLKNGAFSFSGTVAAPIKASLVLRHQPLVPGKAIMMGPKSQDVLQVYLEKGTVTISSKDSLFKAKVSGTPANADFVKLQSQLKPIIAKQDALTDEYIAATAETRKSKEFQAAYTAKSKSIRAEEKAVQSAFIAANPSSLVSLDVLQAYAGSIPENITDIETVFNTLSPTVKNSTRGKEYATALQNMKNVAIGAIAPEFVQNDPNDKPVKLTDFRGKYVLVDFWASWCGPCRAENPHVVKAYEKYKEKNFTILGVSLDQPTGKAAWLKAIQDDKLDWTQVSDLKFWENAVARLYHVRAVPQNFLLDPNGKIIAKNLRGEALDNKLKEILP